jgi:hypothetical protein
MVFRGHWGHQRLFVTVESILRKIFFVCYFALRFVRNWLLLYATFRKQKYRKFLKTFFAQIIFSMLCFHYICTCFWIRPSASDCHLLQCDASYFGGYVPDSEEPVFQIVVSQPRNCGLYFHLCGILQVSACYLSIFFPLNMFLPISSMELMELYCHSPMHFHCEHRDSLYLSTVPHGVTLYYDVLEAKKSAGTPSAYDLPAPLSRMLYLQSQTVCLRYYWVIHCPVCDRCKIIPDCLFFVCLLCFCPVCLCSTILKEELQCNYLVTLFCV